MTLAARFSRSRSPSASAPPTASTASMTRAPARSSTTPGWVTAPATCTAIVAGSPFDAVDCSTRCRAESPWCSTRGGDRRGRGARLARARATDPDAVPDHAGDQRDDRRARRHRSGRRAPVAQPIGEPRQQRSGRTRATALLAPRERRAAPSTAPATRRVAELRVPELLLFAGRLATGSSTMRLTSGDGARGARRTTEEAPGKRRRSVPGGPPAWKGRPAVEIRGG